MVDYTLDMCEAIIQKTHPLYIMFYSKTNETDSNYMDPCPMKVCLILISLSEK